MTHGHFEGVPGARASRVRRLVRRRRPKQVEGLEIQPQKANI
jgi:hypothetical protein